MGGIYITAAVLLHNTWLTFFCQCPAHQQATCEAVYIAVCSFPRTYLESGGKLEVTSSIPSSPPVVQVNKGRVSDSQSISIKQSLRRWLGPFMLKPIEAYCENVG